MKEFILDYSSQVHSFTDGYLSKRSTPYVRFFAQSNSPLMNISFLRGRREVNDNNNVIVLEIQ